MRLTANSAMRRSPGVAALFLAVLLAALLGACATVPEASGTARRDTVDAFALVGRFSLRHQDKNYSGRLTWHHSGADNELLLSSPFGQGIAQITTSDHGARLTTSDGKVYAAADSESLTREVLGYPLPLVQLTDWVRGRSGAAAAEVDGQGRPLSLRHEAWRIDYGYDSDDAQALPSRVFAERADGIELRLRIDEWTSLPATDDPS